MSQKIKSALNIVARLAPFIVAVGLLWFLLSNADWGEMQRALVQADTGSLLVATLLGIATFAMGIVRWRVLLRVFGVDFPLLPLVRLTLEGTTVNLLVPGGFAGDITRAIGIRGRLRHAGDAVSSVVTDRLMGLLGFVLFALIALALKWSLLNDAAIALPVMLLCCLLFTVVALCYSRGLLALMVALLKHVPFVKNIADLVAEGLLRHRSGSRTLILAFAFTLVAHFLQILTTWMIGLSLGVSVGLITYILYVPIIALLAAVPMSHFGMGLREGGFVLMLGLSGVSSELALLLSIIFSVIAIFLPALVGAIIILSRLILTGKLLKRA